MQGAQGGALRRAGEPVTGDQWRQTAFRLETSKAVTAILGAAARALAEDGGSPLDRARRRKLLEKHAQNGSAMVSIAACGALDKMDAYEDGMRAAEPAPDPSQLLREIVSLSPELADRLAEQSGMSVDFELTPAQLAEASERRMAAAFDWMRQHPDQARDFLRMLPSANGGLQQGAPSNVVDIDGPPDFPDDNHAA